MNNNAEKIELNQSNDSPMHKLVTQNIARESRDVEDKYKEERRKERRHQLLNKSNKNEEQAQKPHNDTEPNEEKSVQENNSKNINQTFSKNFFKSQKEKVKTLKLTAFFIISICLTASLFLFSDVQSFYAQQNLPIKIINVVFLYSFFHVAIELIYKVIATTIKNKRLENNE